MAVSINLLAVVLANKECKLMLLISSVSLQNEICMNSQIIICMIARFIKLDLLTVRKFCHYFIRVLGSVVDYVNREFTKPRRQRERHRTKGLLSRTMAVHVRYNSWYISLPFSARQQREMTKLCAV